MECFCGDSVERCAFCNLTCDNFSYHCVATGFHSSLGTERAGRAELAWNFSILGVQFHITLFVCLTLSITLLLGSSLVLQCFQRISEDIMCTNTDRHTIKHCIYMANFINHLASFYTQLTGLNAPR